MGFLIVNVRIPCIHGYNEDQIAIVLDDPSMNKCLIILGTPTLYRTIQVIKDSEISELAIQWETSHLYWLRGLQTQVEHYVREDVANKAIAPACIGEVVRVNSKFQIPLFGYKAIHGRTRVLLMGYKLHIMIHGLEKRSP